MADPTLIPPPPSFSVVIASYNRRAMLLEAIRSVKRQTLAAREVIVVLDGSTDDSAAAVRAEHPDVTLFEQPNLGPGIAHNTGVALAGGDWVCLLDDDDLWHRDKLQATADYLREHPGCLAVRNPVWFFGAADSAAGEFGFRRDFVAETLEQCERAAESADPRRNSFEYLLIEGDSFDRLLRLNSGVLSSTCVERRTLIRAGGFCPMQTTGDDWTMFLNVARLAEWHTIPRRLGFTRLHAGQTTGDPASVVPILATHVNAWLAGRPRPTREGLAETRRRLAGLGPHYRAVFQSYIWQAIRRRRFGTGRLLLRLSGALLPRRRDRLYTLLPPPITWRFERYFLGMHK